jgi:hypothetical protein
MNSVLRIALSPTPEQQLRLLALQAAFARVCNAITPMVRETRVWNRVALHHMAYKGLREQFPGLGSQMVCNAIYSVSRTCRMVYQHPASPFNLARLGGKGLPLLRFADSCPVYFDRHTLSLKDGELSLYTLGGRMHLRLALDAQDEARFHQHKLREIVLSRNPQDRFELTFGFAGESADEQALEPSAADSPEAGTGVTPPNEIPAYVMVEETA